MEESDYDQVVEVPDTPDRKNSSCGRVRIGSAYVLANGTGQDRRQLSLEGSAHANGSELCDGTKYASKGKAAETSESRNKDLSFVTGNKETAMVSRSSKTTISSSDRRASGNRRLVRNGCISPSNIAVRALTLARANDMSSSGSGNGKDCDKVDLVDEVDRKNHRTNGEGITYHSLTSKTSKAEFNGPREKGKRRWGQDPAECSSAFSERDEEVLCLGSSKRISETDPRKVHTSDRKSSLRPIPEIDEHMLEFDVSASVNVGSHSIDRQFLSDERLAFELQELFYDEVSSFDETLAWALQEEENFNSSHHMPGVSSLRQRNASTSSSSRQHHRNASSRAVTSRVDSSNRSLRSRSGRPSESSSRIQRSIPSTSSTRDIQFPLSMDLDMRIEILEAMESAVGDLSDLNVLLDSSSAEVDYMFRSDNHFNNEDYETLLSLDERFPAKNGLTLNQIRSLPESTVQMNCLDETCAICLETPSKGEKIRHLPCLHKFHTECIDTWLGKQKFCPICKASAA